ncbi:MAG: TonB-dependent receptor plug domain-containing protein [Pseudomonadales bacterium]
MKHIRLCTLKPIALAVGLASAAYVAAPAYAQSEAIEEIVVVGSRIQKPDYAFSNPVQSVDAEVIRFSGTTNMGNFLKDYPALVGSLDSNAAAGSNTFIGGTGLTQLNLRNLGTDRTLVLVDGRRHVAALPGSAAVDIDTIPIEMIERVEILTGGASAIYGADGVTGVVNFVMRNDFEGVRLSARSGRSSESDAETNLLSLTGGTALFDGRGHGALAFEYSREERLRANDRDYAGGGKRSSFVSNPFEDTPQRVPLQDIRFFDSSPAGAVDVDFDFVQDFNGTDTPWDEGTIPFIAPFLQQGGDGSRLDQFIGDLLPQKERMTVNAFFDYEFSPRANLFSELKYSRNDSFSRGQPSFDFFLFLEPDYAFYPPNIAAALAGGEALVSRDHFDMGVRGEDIKRETVRGVLGLEGAVTDSINYEVSYLYGETEVKNAAQFNRLNDRFAAALDAVIDPATGNAVCRSNLDPDAAPFNLDWQGWGFDYEPLPGTWAGSFTPGPNSGCVPVNIIGPNAVSQAARDWIMTTSTSQAKIQQHVAQGYLSGDSSQWFSLPAGAVGFAAGLEWRKEESSSTPAAEDRAGLTFGNIIEPVRGDFTVREVFAEVDVPLLADRPGFELLSLDAAARFSDYSTIGDATTWKLGVVWQPIEDVTLRATRAEATRAPNIGELFAPGGQTFQFINDPCGITQLANGTEFRAANCAQILGGLGVDPATFVDPNSASIAGTLQGNRDLSEEVVDTTTIGVILRPRFIPNLTVSIDWYDIDLQDAINTAGPQTAAELCVDLPTVDNDFCNLFVREAGTGAVVDFVQRPLNVASFTTEGIDYTVQYLLDPADWGLQRNIGLFNLRVVGNRLRDLTFVNLPDADPDSDRGEINAPDWQIKLDLTWEFGPAMVNYGLSHFAETQRYTKQTRRANPDIADRRFWNYKQREVHDVHAAFQFQNGARVYGGINNFTNEKPDIGQVSYPVNAVGRFFYFGVDVDFSAFNR